MAPERWRRARLSDVARIAIGGTPQRCEPRFWADADAGHPWLSIADLRGKYVLETAEHISDAGVRSSNAKLIPANTVVMSFKLTIGRVAVTRRDVYSNEAIAAFHVDPSKVDVDWLYYELPRCAERSVADAAVKGATLNTAKLKRLELPLPPLAEQRRIAEILGALDEAIQKTTQIAAKLRQVKRGLFRDLLERGVHEGGALRDPERRPDLFKESRAGRIPKGWEVAELGSLIDPARPIVYGILMPGGGAPGGIPVVKVKDIANGEIKTGDLLLTSPAIDEAHKRSRLRTGDLLFTIRGTVGRAALVPPSLDQANITQDTARLAVTKTNPELVRYALSAPAARSFIEAHTVGVAVRGINLRDVRRIPIVAPPRAEADAIAERLSALDRRIRAEQAEADKLRLLKRGLTDDLLTGRVRVAVEPR